MVVTVAVKSETPNHTDIVTDNTFTADEKMNCFARHIILHDAATEVDGQELALK